MFPKEVQGSFPYQHFSGQKNVSLMSRLGMTFRIPVAEGKSSAQSTTTRGHGPVGCEQCQSEGYLELTWKQLRVGMKWTQFCVHWFSATSEHLHYSGACDRTDIYGMMGGLIRPRRLVDGLVDGSNIVLPEFCSHWKLNLWWVVSIDTSRYSGLQYSAQYVTTRYFHLRQQYAHRHINIIKYIMIYIYIEEYSMHNYIWTETTYTYIYIYIHLFTYTPMIWTSLNAFFVLERLLLVIISGGNDSSPEPFQWVHLLHGIGLWCLAEGLRRVNFGPWCK